MIILKLLLRNLIYIAAIAIANPTNEESENTKRNVSNYILSENIMPMHYKIQFEFTSELLLGECEIIIYIMDATQHIAIHIPSWMSTTKWELKQINNKVIYKVKLDLDFDHLIDDDNIFTLYVDDVLLRGLYILYIQFSIPIEFVTDTFATLHIGKYEEVQRKTEE